MPYIKKDIRDKLEKNINELSINLSSYGSDDIEGILNYIITEIICRNVKISAIPEEGWRYRIINRAIGILECVKLEFYRRIATPYENIAIQK